MNFIKTFLIMAVLIISTSCAMFNKRDYTYTTAQGYEIQISNKNISLFVRSVQATSSVYQTVQRSFVLTISKAELAGDTERADLIYNQFKPLDDAIRASFKGLAMSTSTTLTIAAEMEKKQLSVPKALINHAGDILILVGQLVPLAEEYGIELPPSFDKVLAMLGVLSR